MAIRAVAIVVPTEALSAAVAVRVSIGIAQRGPDSGDAAELLRSADFAMYSAKRAGKGRFEVFDARKHDDMVADSVPRWDLAEAITSGEVRLDYQPVVELSSGRIFGVEALVRRQHPALGVPPQADDVTVARETRDIRALGHWALETAVRQVADWRETMPRCADLWVSVGLSRRQSTSPEFLALVQRCLEDPSVRAGGLVLEVAETALAADVEAGIAGLRALRGAGARIAIDGFGSGVLSLSSLATLPVDIVKIDRSTVPGGGTDFTPEAVLARILGLASVITRDLIVEGIETVDQLELLRKLDCRTGQGSFLAGPLTAPAFEALLLAGGIAPLADVIS